MRVPALSFLITPPFREHKAPTAPERARDRHWHPVRVRVLHFQGQGRLTHQSVEGDAEVTADLPG